VLNRAVSAVANILKAISEPRSGGESEASCMRSHENIGWIIGKMNSEWEVMQQTA
jgi:hypothetical protein